MSTLPISEPAQRAAREAFCAHNGTFEEHMHDAIQAFLEAEGFELEHRGSHFPDGRRPGYTEHRNTHHRLVSGWVPMHDEDA